MEKTKKKTTMKDKYLLLMEENSKELLEKDLSLATVLFVDTDNKDESGKNKVFICPLNNLENDDKKETMNFIGKKMDGEGILVKGLTLISEAWCLKGDKSIMKKEDIDKYYKEHGSIKNHPLRTEAIIIADWEIKSDKKTMISQEFSIKKKKVVYGNRDKISIKKGNKDSRFYLLEYFLKGYLKGSPKTSKK